MPRYNAPCNLLSVSARCFMLCRLSLTVAKHCYGGLGMVTCLDPPTLPDVDVTECKNEEVV